MLELIWLLPTFPLLGFLTLVLTGGTLPKQIAGNLLRQSSTCKHQGKEAQQRECW